MKKLIAIALLWAGRAEAQQIGCFVEFSNPDQCSTTEWHCGDDNNANLYLAGYSVAVICRDYNDCLAGYNGYSVAYEDLNRAYTAQQKLINRLRKKCGKSCKKIK